MMLSLIVTPVVYYYLRDHRESQKLTQNVDVEAEQNA